MASSPEFVEFAGQKASRSPEKSNFSQTCSLLSQYLKERGSFGDLSLGMTCNGEGSGNGSTPETLHQTAAATTMNLFPMNDKQDDISSRKMAASRTNFRSMDLFPQQAGFAPKEETQKKVDSRAATPEPQTAQMTIFYAGKVIVFNDFPADKAKEIMQLASKGSSQNFTRFPSAPVKSVSPVFAPNAAARPTIESSSSRPSSPGPNSVPNFSNNLIQDHIQPSPQTITSDLPIARRASLQRFLEKRKDRVIARAPYPMSSHSSAAAAPSKEAESKSWLGLAQ
ncbi:hypothetical protein JCGZ_07511 [Jatropha curcas]|uniref:Protein TIFY n=1 Tax=Jatropha curcas TaxID=180498 RepID=A0A067KNS0_JATCU|nr:protein TIFY 10B [Jatropha curcas]KDP33940.1 hypothetical protein JCGZ_07511 [Jatropha curcas]